jgi:hypothetical protein
MLRWKGFPRFILLSFMYVYVKLDWSHDVKWLTSLNHENKVDIGLWTRMMNDPSGTSVKSHIHDQQVNSCLIKKWQTQNHLLKVKIYWIRTACKNMLLAWVIELHKTIMLMEVDLLINSRVIVLVQALVLEHFIPYTRTAIVHQNGIFCFLSP